MGFFEGNLDLVFFTTLRLVLPSRMGICSSKISVFSQLKKREYPLVSDVEILEQHDEQHSTFR